MQLIQVKPINYFGNRTIESKVIYNNFLCGKKFKTLYEPFAGSAAFSTFAMGVDLAENYVINDSYEWLTQGFSAILKTPNQVIDNYQSNVKYLQQCSTLAKKMAFYENKKDRLNRGDGKSITQFDFLFLNNFSSYHIPVINSFGHYQSNFSLPSQKKEGLPDIANNIQALSSLYKKHSIRIQSGSFTDTLKKTGKNELVFLDPPYPDLPKNSNIYHMPDSTDKLHKKLIEQVTKLNQTNSYFILLYGTFDVEKHYILNKINLKLQHWILYSEKKDSLFNQTLEHCYVSSNLTPATYSIFQYKNSLLIPYDQLKEKSLTDALFFCKLHFQINHSSFERKNTLIQRPQSISINGDEIAITPREWQVIELLYQGNSAKQTAWQLKLSTRTIEGYLSNIKKKTRCRSKLELLSKLTVL